MCPVDSIVQARERAWATRAHLPGDERRMLEGIFYAGRDGAKAISAYEELDGRIEGGTWNLARLLRSRREFVRAESLFRLVWPPGTPVRVELLLTLGEEGKTREMDSVLAVYATQVDLNAIRFQRACMRVPPAQCQGMIDSLRARNTPGASADPAIAVARMRGQLSESDRLSAEQRTLAAARGQRDRAGYGDVWNAIGADFLRGRVDAVVTRLDSLGSQRVPFFIAKMALDYADAGRADRARQLLGRLEAEGLDTTSENIRMHMHRTRASIASVERRWAEAIALTKAADLLPDGPGTGDAGGVL